MTNTGKAYGFFNCRASKREISDELPKLRDAARTPSNLELSLIEGVDNLSGDSDFMDIVQEAKEAGMKYVMEATYHNASNEEAAEELADIFNQAYQSKLYQSEKGEPFCGNIAYKGANGYIFKD